MTINHQSMCLVCLLTLFSTSAAAMVMRVEFTGVITGGDEFLDPIEVGAEISRNEGVYDGQSIVGSFNYDTNLAPLDTVPLDPSTAFHNSFDDGSWFSIPVIKIDGATIPTPSFAIGPPEFPITSIQIQGDQFSGTEILYQKRVAFINQETGSGDFYDFNIFLSQLVFMPIADLALPYEISVGGGSIGIGGFETLSFENGSQFYPGISAGFDVLSVKVTPIPIPLSSGAGLAALLSMLSVWRMCGLRIRWPQIK